LLRTSIQEAGDGAGKLRLWTKFGHCPEIRLFEFRSTIHPHSEKAAVELVLIHQPSLFDVRACDAVTALTEIPH
jgi:hypothetical protein